MLTKNTANPEYCVIPIPSTTEVSCACAGARWALWPPACTACRVVWPVLLRVLSALPARLGSVALGGGQTPCPTPISCSSVARGRAPRPSPLLAMARAGVRGPAPRPARRTEAIPWLTGAVRRGCTCAAGAVSTHARQDPTGGGPPYRVLRGETHRSMVYSGEAAASARSTRHNPIKAVTISKNNI